MTKRYCPPVNPPDPEAAALDLLVLAPEVAGTTRFGEPLQDLAAVLELEGAFTGLRWSDALQVAATVAFDAMTEDHPELVLRDRARTLLAYSKDQWVNPLVARAFTAAADML
jgi:hypothetical protein